MGKSQTYVDSLNSVPRFGCTHQRTPSWTEGLWLVDGLALMMKVAGTAFICPRNALSQYNVQLNSTLMMSSSIYLVILFLLKEERGRKPKRLSSKVLNCRSHLMWLLIPLGKRSRNYRKRKVVLSVYELNQQPFGVFVLVRGL